MGIPFSEGAFFSKLKFRVFCYSQTGIRIARIVPKECTLGRFFVKEESNSSIK